MKNTPRRRLHGGRLGLMALAMMAVWGVAWGQLTLPQWSEEEWELWETESPLLGGTLFPGSDPASEEVLPEPLEVPELEVPEEVPRTTEIVSLGVVEDLPAKLVPDYFPERLEQRLLDPQSLLTQSRLDEIHHFLDYHFSEARSAIHIMVLKPLQRLPSEIDLQQFHRRWFAEEELAVLVIYNFGNPEMSRLIFGAEAKKRVSEARRIEACVEAINQAIVVGNAEDQLERFLTDLSRSLYWIEDDFHGARPGVVSRPIQERFREALLAPSKPPEVEQGSFWFTVLLAASMVVLIGAGIAFLQRRAANRTYYFPERPRASRLGCPRGGGNRLVVSFGGGANPRVADPVNAAAGRDGREN